MPMSVYNGEGEFFVPSSEATFIGSTLKGIHPHSKLGAAKERRLEKSLNVLSSCFPPPAQCKVG